MLALSSSRSSTKAQMVILTFSMLVLNFSVVPHLRYVLSNVIAGWILCPEGYEELPVAMTIGRRT